MSGRFHILIATSVVFLILGGCNDSGFSGSTSPEKKEKAVTSGDPNDDFIQDSDAEGSKPTPSLGLPGEADKDTDFGDFFDGLGDNDLGDFDPDITIEDNSVTFGANEVYRLGDGSFDASSCKFTVNTFDLSGTRFFFEFEVKEDNTQISIQINRICGVDYPDSNHATLYRNGQRVESMLIPPGSAMLSFTTSFVNAGSYRIEVESRTGSSQDVLGTDADDFIIGNLTIRGSKQIDRGSFGAQ